MAALRIPTWDSAGYTPKYRFASSGDENAPGLYDVTGLGSQPFTGQDLATQRFGPVPMYDANNRDPRYQFDHAAFLRAASGQPGTGWAQGDNAGQGETFWSWLVGNNATIPLLATSAILGVNGAAGAAAQAAQAGTGVVGTIAANPSTYWGALQGAEHIAGDQSPSTILSSVGSIAGGAAGTATGLPGLSTVGGVVGHEIGAQFDGSPNVQGVGGSVNTPAQGAGDVRQVNSRSQRDVGDFSLDAPTDTGGGGAFDGGVWSAVDSNGTVLHDSAPGGSGSGWGSINDWLKAVALAGGVTNTGLQALNSANASGKANDAAGLQSQIAQQLFNEASPLRQQNIAQLGQFAQTGQLPPALSVGLDALRTTGRQDLESQYNVAKQNILSQTPVRGGQLGGALAGLETARAGSVGRLGSDILSQTELPLRQNLYQLAVNQGLAQSTTGLQAVGGAATNFMSLAKSAAAEAGASGQGTGALLALLYRNQARAAA